MQPSQDEPVSNDTSKNLWSPFGEPRSFMDDAHEANPVPNRETMEARWRFRDGILRETADHRRIHPHRPIGRNILQVLYDRERKGARAVTSYRRRLRQKGDRSPATVFDSPNSATSSVYEHGATVLSHEDDQFKQSFLQQESISNLLQLRSRNIYPCSIEHEIRFFAEYSSTVRYHSAFLKHLGGDDVIDGLGTRPESSSSISTISVAFSPDGQTMASTHGDHTVKISCCNTGRLLQSLEGHPRTPWTIKYHPTDPNIIASGCLGHQVRIWNWLNKQCLQMIRLDFAIISVAFHPSGTLLAVANGTRLHFWGIDAQPPSSAATSSEHENRRSTLITEIDQRHMLRCVHFPPNGKTIIIGGVNPTSDDPRRRQRGGIGGGGMSFYLRLWDFDVNTALRPNVDLPPGIPSIRRAIINPRTFVPRALLYNDGGFDVSPDGKTLCACAEYWLPEGVDNAMDLLVKEECALDPESLTREAAELSSDATMDTPSASRTHSVVSAALLKLEGLSQDTNNRAAAGRSPSFREDMQMPLATAPPRTPGEATPTLDFVPRTPPIPRDQEFRLSPPSPPGRRFSGRGGREVVTTVGSDAVPESHATLRGLSTPPPPPPPPPPSAPGGSRPPHPLSIVTATANRHPEVLQTIGRYVPHVVTVSLETATLPPELEYKWPRGKHPGAVANGYRPRLGQLLEACPLDTSKASAVTCVKFSPSTDFCLIGYGVREPEGGGKFHPVSALYRCRGGMTHVSTMLSEIDDVNIARFHPDSGHGFVYGTKQGRVRVLSPRPWNFYSC